MLAKEDTKTIVLEGAKLVYVDQRQTKSCTKINYRCKRGCPVRYHLCFILTQRWLHHIGSRGGRGSRGRNRGAGGRGRGAGVLNEGETLRRSKRNAQNKTLKLNLNIKIFWFFE